MIRIMKYLRAKEWGMIFLSILCIVAQVQLDLKLPEYMSEITKLVQTEGSAIEDVWSAGGKMMICAFASLILAVILGFLSAQIASRFSYRLREGVYKKVLSFTDEEMNRFSTASLITRSTNDITQVQMFVVMGLALLIKAPITAFIALRKISTKNWQWTALTGGAIFFICILLAFVMIYAIPRFKKMQVLTDNLNRVTRENLTGLLVVRAYNAENFQENKFSDANEELTRTQLQAQIAMTVMSPGLNLAMNGLTLGIYWIGAVLIGNITITDQASLLERVNIFSDMVVFINYAMQVVMAFLMLVVIFIMLPRVSVSANRLNEVLRTDVRMKDGSKTEGKPDMRGEIEFQNVSFRYKDSAEDVIHNISFKAHQGETVALIGATGSGKSTIINLIPRLYDTTEGTVLFDGVDVREYSTKALREKIGFVPQKAFLFSGTVADNIGYGDENISEDGLKKAASIAQASEFVETNEVGYEGHVSQNGSNFSGGQKQRLSIARAIAKDAEVFVFDDSFSALDYRTDKTLRSALKKELNGVTNIIVAQRIGTIMDADRILVIEDGEIVGNGTHKELMQSCNTYKEIAYSQLSKEELGA
ncbi:MAG: ABC transporter ATP-binding protein/permease [Saccharofermentans sp.]|nr:ABC transporter ATP-binding protein/permease [Saccharofermentans sp.]